MKESEVRKVGEYPKKLKSNFRNEKYLILPATLWKIHPQISKNNKTKKKFNSCKLKKKKTGCVDKKLNLGTRTLAVHILTN